MNQDPVKGESSKSREEMCRRVWQKTYVHDNFTMSHSLVLAGNVDIHTRALVLAAALSHVASHPQTRAWQIHEKLLSVASVAVFFQHSDWIGSKLMIIPQGGKYIANSSLNVQCAPTRLQYDYGELLQLIIIIIIIISLLWSHSTADQQRLNYLQKQVRSTCNIQCITHIHCSYNNDNNKFRDLRPG